MTKIVFVANVDWFFISHRLPLAKEALKRGYEVYLLTANTGHKSELEQIGIKFVEIPFERSGRNPIHEIKCIYILTKFFKQIKPDIIHQITLKASLLGCIAAKICKFKNVVNAISGLGYNFTNDRNGISQKATKLIIKLSYRSRYFSFILQNPDDIALIKQMNIINEKKIYLIKGSGVNLNEYKYTTPISKDKLIILFPARILIDKGVMEFINAAKLLKKQIENKVVFILAGDCDKNNLSALREEQLTALMDDNYIKWIGFQKDMIKLYKNSDIVVLPSYREGLPKSLIEACAIGRPIITTDVPGCRECVENNINGFKVPAKEIASLADCIVKLVNDNNQRLLFGRNSRKLAEREFSIENVINRTFSIYNNILQQ